MTDNPTLQSEKLPSPIYIPYGPAQLMAVSPELQNNDGAWYVLMSPEAKNLRDEILALQTDAQGELPSMYNKALRDAAEIVSRAPVVAPQEDEHAPLRAAVEVAETYRAAQDGWRNVPTRHEVQAIIAKHVTAPSPSSPVPPEQEQKPVE